MSDDLAEYLECSLCLSLFCEPLTIPCGHTFCRMCLIGAMSKSTKKCPNCRAVCHINPVTHQESTVITNIARACFPEEYARRQMEAATDKEQLESILPIFYLNTYVFPGNRMDLHFFEQRYRLMMKRIVDGDRRFAYLPNFGSYKAEVGDVGVVALLEECEFLSDGRVLVKIKMGARLRVQEHWVEEGTQNLHFCRMEEIHDIKDECDAEELQCEAEEARQKVAGLLELLNDGQRFQLNEAVGPLPTKPELVPFWVARVAEWPNEISKFLLESTSPITRLRLCTRVLAGEDVTDIVPAAEPSPGQCSCS